MSEPANEKRRFSRVDFNTVTTIANSDKRWQSNLIDISLKGLLVELPDGWNGETDDKFEVNVELSENEIAIKMNVSVAHIENQHIGFRCETIDSDSITHLRRLMELNLGDAELVNRELSMLEHH